MAADLSGATIAFDLDGTLVDTAPDIVGALNTLLNEEGLAGVSLEVGRLMIGHGGGQTIERGFAAAGRKLDSDQVAPMFDRYRAHYAARIADESRVFPGCEAALSALAETGAKLCVCTNKRTDFAERLLESFGLSKHFSVVVGSDLADAPKPDPRHLLAAIAAAGGAPYRALLVGDSPIDAAAAKAAGVGLVLVSFGYSETPVVELAADRMIDHFDELPAVCAALLGACG